MYLFCIEAKAAPNFKEQYLTWARNMLQDYDLPVSNLHESWQDGYAFCALVHKLNSGKDIIDMSEIKKVFVVVQSDINNR